MGIVCQYSDSCSWYLYCLPCLPCHVLSISQGPPSSYCHQLPPHCYIGGNPALNTSGKGSTSRKILWYFFVFSFAHLGDGKTLGLLTYVTDSSHSHQFRQITPALYYTGPLLHRPYITLALYYTGPILHRPFITPALYYTGPILHRPYITPAL